MVNDMYSKNFYLKIYARKTSLIPKAFIRRKNLNDVEPGDKANYKNSNSKTRKKRP